MFGSWRGLGSSESFLSFAPQDSSESCFVVVFRYSSRFAKSSEPYFGCHICNFPILFRFSFCSLLFGALCCDPPTPHTHTHTHTYTKVMTLPIYTNIRREKDMTSLGIPTEIFMSISYALHALHITTTKLSLPCSAPHVNMTLTWLRWILQIWDWIRFL